MRTLLLVTTAALAVTCIAEDEDGHVANTEQLFAMGQHRRRWALMPHMAVPPKITTVPTATSGADSNVSEQNLLGCNLSLLTAKLVCTDDH